MREPLKNCFEIKQSTCQNPNQLSMTSWQPTGTVIQPTVVLLEKMLPFEDDFCGSEDDERSDGRANATSMAWQRHNHDTIIMKDGGGGKQKNRPKLECRQGIGVCGDLWVRGVLV